MSLEALLSSENPQNLVDSTLDKHFQNTNEEKFYVFVNEIGNSKLSYDILVSLLSGSIKRIGTEISNPKVQLSCLESIQKLLETRNVKDIEDQLLEQVAKTYEALEMYADAAKILLQRQGPNRDLEENQYLDYYEHVGELWLKAGNLERLQQSVTQLNSCIFRQRTPREFQDRFDFLHGYSAAFALNFQDAIRAFSMIVNNSKDKGNVILALCLSSICVCLNLSSKNNALLKLYYEDENVKKFEFFNLIDLMAREQFIDQAARDDFLANTKTYFKGMDMSEPLIKSSLQHNLKVAQKFFTCVKIERLAQLIGSTPIDVEKQMKRMIVNDQIKALIDQDAKMVQFINEPNQAEDESIEKYSQAINSLVKDLQ